MKYIISNDEIDIDHIAKQLNVIPVYVINHINLITENKFKEHIDLTSVIITEIKNIKNE